MPQSILDNLKALALRGVPKVDSQQDSENQTLRAKAIQDTWSPMRRKAIGAIDTIGEFGKGLLLDDPATDESFGSHGTARAIGGLANTLPLMGAMGSLKKLPIIAPEAYQDVKAGGLKLYSRLTDTFAKAPTKMKPAKAISLAQSGASREEINLRKLNEFLKGRDPLGDIPREEIMGHLAANPLELDVVRKGESGYTGAAREAREALNRFQHDLDTRYGANWEAPHVGGTAGREVNVSPRAISQADWEHFTRLQQEADDLAQMGSPGNVEYGFMQTPGPSENYGESLIKMPESRELQVAKQQFQELNNKFAPIQREMAYLTVGHPRYAEVEALYKPLSEEKARLADLINELEAQEFTSGHFPSDPNTLVWSRHNDRSLAPQAPYAGDLQNEWVPTDEPGSGPLVGPKGRFVEEIQSDWHQQGREYGYRGEPVNEDNIKDLAKKSAMSYPPDNEVRNILTKMALDQQVPDAPFKDTYHELAIKQQLLDAANDPSLEWLGVADAHTNANLEGHRVTRAGTQLGYDEKNPNALSKLLNPLGGNVEHVETPWPSSGSNTTARYKDYSIADYPSDSSTVPPGSQRVVDFHTNPGQGTHVLDLPARDNSQYNAIADLAKSQGRERSQLLGPGTGMWKASLTPELKALIRERGFPAMTLMLALQQAFAGKNEQ